MVSFMVVLLFAPVLAWFTWMYTSPLPRYTPVKVMIRLLWAVAILGGIIAQLAFLAHNNPLNARRFYGMALLVIEGIPLLFLLLYRCSGTIGFRPVDRTDGEGKNGNK
jgi:hypothetical protein